jgi:hypothetical protein
MAEQRLQLLARIVACSRHDVLDFAFGNLPKQL